jgi:hypothetical protein
VSWTPYQLRGLRVEADAVTAVSRRLEDALAGGAPLTPDEVASMADQLHGSSLWLGHVAEHAAVCERVGGL